MFYEGFQRLSNTVNGFQEILRYFDDLRDIQWFKSTDFKDFKRLYMILTDFKGFQIISWYSKGFYCILKISKDFIYFKELQKKSKDCKGFF